MEDDLWPLRKDVRLLTDRVRDLEPGRDIDETRILHAYDHLEGAHS